MCIYTSIDTLLDEVLMGALNRLKRRGFRRSPYVIFTYSLVVITTAFALCFASPVGAQQSGQQTQNQQKPQQTTPEAGGPQGDLGPIAVPKKSEEAPPPPPPTPKTTEGMPNYSISVDVPLVNLDVMVLSKDGHFIPGLKKEHFRVLEDGVPQSIQNFSVTEAPITAVLLVEFSNTNYQFMYDALNASYAFAEGLKKDDWVAVIEYDMKPYILVDFTQDKNAVYGGLNQLRVPGFSESNLFDALYDTLDRIDKIEGRKEIILVGSGRDTFSRLTYDKVLKKIKDTPNVTIFTVSTGRAFKEYIDTRYGNNAQVREMMLDYLQAENQMATFAKMTGGRAYNPRFEAEFREIFRDVASSIRNQYTITYHSTNAKQDGSYRKLKVELVAPGSETPLVIKDQKNKELKYNIVAREGYTAKNVVE
jgi:VWFA-related protein